MNDKEEINTLYRPSSFKGLNLDNLLGKFEMEIVTKTIINMAIKKGDDFENCPVNIFSFDSNEERHGFSFLLYYGWLEEDGSGNFFVVGNELIKRLIERKRKA